MEDFNHACDIAKLRILQTTNSAFLGPLICSMNIIPTNELRFAGTDGVNIFVNPDDFLNLPHKSRLTLLMHQVWHAAKLHHTRGGNRDSEKWNDACDIHINKSLLREGMTFDGLPETPEEYLSIFDSVRGESEEEIYEMILQNQPQGQQPNPNGQDGEGESGSGEGQGEGNPNSDGDPSEDENEGEGNSDGQPKPNKDPNNPNGDLLKQTMGQAQEQTSNVIQAAQTAKMQGSGCDPKLLGSVETLIDDFYKPKLDWKVLLNKYLNDLNDKSYTWKKRNRRYSDWYLPSLQKDENKLEHLAYYLDVSGSVSDDDVKRFNSELKYIFDNMKPSKITVVMFDTGIRKEVIFNEGDSFDKILIEGRGGTCLRCVRKHILENKPTAAIIFSDMYCDDMEPFKQDTDLIWVVVNGRKPNVFKGKVIEVNT